MRGFQDRLNEFNARGVRLAAISVDSPAVNRGHCAKQGYTYTFLSDAGAEVIRRYGLLHPRGGAEGSDVARPAEFLVDPDGVVRWVNLTEDYRVRARADEVLQLVDRMKSS